MRSLRSLFHPSSVFKKKVPIFILGFLMLPLAFLLLFSCFPDSETDRFTAFTEDVFRHELSGNTLNLHYMVTDPKAYAIDADHISLGSADLSSRRNSRSVIENYYSALNQFDRRKLSDRQKLTYDIFADYLETELSAAQLLFYEEPLSPTLGIQAQLPILLAEYEFRIKGDIEDYLCLLTQIPDYFASVCSFEREKSAAGLFMSRDCALDIVQQCQEFTADAEQNYLITVFNEKIDRISNLTADEKIGYKSRNQAILNSYVIPAYQMLMDEISSLSDTGKNEMGLYYFPQGQDYYQYLIRSKVGDDRTIEVIEEEIKNQMVADYTALQDLISRYGSQETEAVSAAFSALSSSSALPGTSQLPSVILSELRQKITDDFPLLPNVSCNIKYVHPSLQEHLSPAFYLTPAIDDFENNVIYINPSGNYSELDLFTTLAHEGYPGHLFQSVYFHASEPDLLRTLLDTGGYTEGWATYVEMYAYSLWEKDPILAAVSQRNRSFTLGLASLLDIGIHYRGYTPEDVKIFLNKLGFEDEMAASLYQSILQAPANYLQYYVGYLNFERLQNVMQTKLGRNFSLKKFHTAVLDAGPMPFSILEQHLYEVLC